MLTQKTALDLIAADGDTERSYRAVASQLGLPAGLVYMIATGVPADSSDGLSADDLKRPGLLPSAQRLVNPPVVASDPAGRVRGFVAARVRADAQMRAAAAQQDQD